ncbi:UvrD-helicase domain-containing protein [Candidatus Nitrosopelagicus sp.]|nr:UvrD-helicase domain-containing protein [Candidatus Nitrosopelagicus sp.]
MAKSNPGHFPPSKEQKAILAVKKDTIVISNPGTGKTTTLAFKVLDLLDSHVEPEEIMCLTFTTKAKKEMQDKLYEMARGKYPESVMIRVNVNTFHGFASNYLSDAGLTSGDVVGNNLLRYSVLESFIENKALHYEKKYIIERLIGKIESAIRHMKTFGITYDKINIKKTQSIIQTDYTPTPAYSKDDLKAFVKYFVDAYKHYESRKNDGEIDFADMMLMFIDKHKGEKYEHVLVDEMQDMNELQAEIVRKISKNLFLVGDSKQAIFGFQGGSIKNFQKFEKQCKPMLLSTNRRSTQEILNYSKNFFIMHTEQKTKYKKELKNFTSKDNGPLPKIFSTKAPFGKTVELIKANPKKSIGVIARTNKQVIQISKYLDAKNIPYTTTTSQATTQEARVDLISFVKGILSDSMPHKVSAAFSVFSTFSLQEAFGFSVEASKKGVKSIPKLDSWKIKLHRDDLNKIFADTILPVCISKGSEWFATAVSVKEQIDEYLLLQNPTFEGLFDFIAIGEQEYPDRDQKSGVTITTIHKAKGREFDVAIYIPKIVDVKESFVDVISTSVFKALGVDVKDEVLEEPFRMDFVAMTRAKEKLFVITDDTYLGMYYQDKLSDFETDSKEEEKITVASMNSRLTEAYSMFVAGKLKESQKHMKKKETWIKDLIAQYFKNVDHFYWSAIQTSPYVFLKKSILHIPYDGGGSGGGAGGTELGDNVHKAIQKILIKKAKPSDYKDDELKAIKNAMACLKVLEKTYPGFKFKESEKYVTAVMSDMTNYTKKDGLYFSGYIDAVFEHDDGIILVDWKTNRSKSNNEPVYKRQLAVYKKMYSKQKDKIPEEKITTCLIWLALRGGIRTNKFESDMVYGQRSSVYSTFEKHLQRVLAWRNKPNDFLTELAQEKDDDDEQPIQGIIKDKLASLGIK